MANDETKTSKNTPAAASAPQEPTPEPTPELEGLEAVQSLIGSGDAGKAAEAVAVALNTGTASKVAIEAVATFDLAAAKKLVNEAAAAKITDSTVAAKWLHKKYPERRAQLFVEA